MNWKLLFLASTVISILSLLRVLTLDYHMEGFQVLGDDSKPIEATESECGALMDQLRAGKANIEKYRDTGESSSLAATYKVYDAVLEKVKKLNCKETDSAPKVDVDPKELELTAEQKVMLQKQTKEVLSTVPK